VTPREGNLSPEYLDRRTRDRRENAVAVVVAAAVIGVDVRRAFVVGAGVHPRQTEE